MNDFSFSNIFRSAFDALFKNFADIFLLTVFSVSAVLVMSLFSNYIFLGRVNIMMNAAIADNIAHNAANTNPFILFSLYIGFILVFAALVMFCMFSLLLPLCRNKVMKLKNFVPSFKAILLFILSLTVLFAVFEFIIVVFPLIAKSVSADGGYSAGFLAVSVISFAVIVCFVVIALKYIFFFLPLLENISLKEAFKKSRSITLNRRAKIFVYFAVLFIINYFAKYLIFLLLLTLPFSILAVIYVYLELSGLEFKAAEPIQKNLI